jgi:hypothetical protein
MDGYGRGEADAQEEVFSRSFVILFAGAARTAQGRDTLDRAFTATGVRDRLQLLGLGDRVTI